MEAATSAHSICRSPSTETREGSVVQRIIKYLHHNVSEKQLRQIRQQYPELGQKHVTSHGHPRVSSGNQSRLVSMTGSCSALVNS
jgi:hypothetical protein